MTPDTWNEVAALAQVATVGVAGWALVYARRQVKDARATQDRVAQPDVVAYVDHHHVRRYFDLVIKNFGQTTAYNIKLIVPPLQVASYESRIDGEVVTTLTVPEVIAVLAPGQEWRTLWDSYVRRERHNGPLQTKFVGRIDFDDSVVPVKPHFSNPVSLDTNMFHNTTWIEKSSSNASVQNALYDIAGTLKGYSQEEKGIWTYSDSGDKERDRREQEHQQWLRDQERFQREIGLIQDSPPGETPKPEN